MNGAEVIAKLKAAEPRSRAHGVAALYLFGSYARDKAREGSDIDVFVDKTPGRKFGLDEFIGAHAVRQDSIPGTEIGYTTREGLVGCYRPLPEQSTIRIF